MSLSPSSFPPQFLWGAATASYQIEGAAFEDGRGESIWDRFSHTPGKVQDGDTGDIACDHYHRWPQDIALMQTLGLQAYRFSIAWPRIFPQGRGKPNQAGLDFYSRLVDALLEAHITPFVTLYHWDLPQALEDEGGWTARSTAEAFAVYADIVSRHLGDRVAAWATLNEPWVSAWLGYLEGVHAPGNRNLDQMLAASHHLLLGHGLALRHLRANCPQAPSGIVLNYSVVHSASDRGEDQKAAAYQDGYINRWYLDPLKGRGYPQDIVEKLGRPLPFIQAGDFETIAASVDFLGLNYYTRDIPAATPDGGTRYAAELAGPERTEMDWEVYPQGLYEMLHRVHKEYTFPAYFITENGAAFLDQVSKDGAVHDEARTRYLQRHFEQAARAIQEGIPLQGYFVWSLLDNFEWAFGYSKRFGIVYIDYQTQQRTLKDSALWYKTWIAQRIRETP